MAVGQPDRVAAALHVAGEGALRRRDAIHATLRASSGCRALIDDVAREQTHRSARAPPEQSFNQCTKRL
jgi:hypothetical protein